MSESKDQAAVNGRSEREEAGEPLASGAKLPAAGGSRRDPIAELCELLEEAGAKVTLSIWCRSGIVGREACICWRCRGEEGPSDDESEAEAAARRIDREDLRRRLGVSSRYWAAPGSVEDGTVALHVPGLEHRISLEEARLLARELGEAADEVYCAQLRARLEGEGEAAAEPPANAEERQAACSNCGGIRRHRRCRDCGGTGRCPPRTSGRRPAGECNTCRGWGCVPPQEARGG